MPTATRKGEHAAPRFRETRPRSLLLILYALTTVLLLSTHSHAQQATLTDDTSYPKSGGAGGPGGGGPPGGQVSQGELALKVRGPGASTGAATAFIKFKLTGGSAANAGDLPSGTPGAHVERATLRLFVGGVASGGAFDVYRVTGSWTEGGASAPPYDAASPLAAGVQVTAAGSFVTVDITPLVRQWLDYDPNDPSAGGHPNHGLALAASASAPNTSLEFDSKESTQTSHHASLGVVLNHAKTADRATSAAIADHATSADTAASAGHADTATTASTIAAPLTLASADASHTLSVVNTGGGAALTASGDINTSASYNIGGRRVLGVTAANNVYVGADAGASDAGANNAFFGTRAGFANTTGVANAFFGTQAGRSNTTGCCNAFFGTDAGRENTTGTSNSFFGFHAGGNNQTGFQNSFFGTFAGVSNTTGSNNSFFGRSAGGNNSTGQQNSFFGASAGLANSTGSNNASFGASAGSGNTEGGANSSFGAGAGRGNTTGGGNSFFGFGAGRNNTTGGNNVFVGASSGLSNTTESSNTFVGAGANGVPGITNATAVGAGAVVTQSGTMVLGTNAVTVQIPGTLNVTGTFNFTVPAGSPHYIQNTTGQQAASFNITGDGSVGGSLNAGSVNSAAGYSMAGSRVLSADHSNTVVGLFAGKPSPLGGYHGGSNTFVGRSAGSANQGFSNSFFGQWAGEANTTGGQNSFFGNTAGNVNAEGDANSFFGHATGVRNTTGSFNSFFGAGAGSNNVSGWNNSFFGVNSGAYSTGSENSFFGLFSGHESTTGSYNTFVGVFAGQFNFGGQSNTFVGHGAGRKFCSVNCSNNTAVGANASTGDNVSNATAVGAGAVADKSNSVVLGDSTADVGIGTTAPQAKLHVQNGNILVGSPGQGIILRSPDGATCRLLTIDNSGALALAPAACPVAPPSSP